MKRFLAALLAAVLLCILIGCGQNPRQQDLAGKTFYYEKGGFGGYFYIILFEDQTFQYYAGPLSSFIGIGTWETEEDRVILTHGSVSGYAASFTFRVDDGCLVYQKDSSDEFMYIEVADGDRFFTHSE